MVCNVWIKTINVITDGESKPATMDEIENNWIIEHARQVDIYKL